MKNHKLAAKVLSAAFALTVMLSSCSGQPSSKYITRAEYNQIHTGMSYEQVCKIVGSNGTIMSESGEGRYYTMMVVWYENSYNGDNAVIMFQNNAVISKAQTGLQ